MPFKQAVDAAYEVAARISPQTINAAGSATSSYVFARDKMTAMFSSGTVTTSSTVTCSFLQATDDQGTDAKALTSGGFANVTFSATEDDVDKFITGLRTGMDLANGFTYIAIRIAVAGGTSAAMCGHLFSGARFGA